MDTILCQVCYRPGPELICSRRCKGLLKLKSHVHAHEVRRRVLDELAKLPGDASLCPGRLSKLVLDGIGVYLKEERDALSLIRETLFAMRDEGLLRFLQKNQVISKGKGPMDIKGPFRVKGRT
jgi:hypothetical protein